MVQAIVEKTKRCLKCGHDIPQSEGITTGYLVTENGREFVGRIWFCSQSCADECFQCYANPVFQNEKARQLFMMKHPDRYNRIAGKPKLFLEA